MTELNNKNIQNLKRFSTASLNRQQDFPPYPLPPELTALTSFAKSQESKTDKQYDLKTLKAGKCVDMWKRSPCNLAVPSEVDVSQFINCTYFQIFFYSKYQMILLLTRVW